jgi:UDP-glucose-4-epimerase GalE
MRVLVTGGAGYIGGFTTRALLDAGHEVTVLDTLDAGRADAVGDASLVIGDFGDRDLVREQLRSRGVEAVMHFAGLKSVAESVLQPDRYLAVNHGGTARLLGAMADAGVDLLIYSGTCGVYGAPDRLPVDETAPIAPINPYAQSKWLAEQEMQRAHREGALRYCALRYFNAAGAALAGTYGEDLAHAPNLVPVVIRTALGMTPYVPVYGTDYPTADGTAVRDYVHVLDLASAHLRALDYLCEEGAPGPLNLGTGKGTSVREVVAAAERASGITIATRDHPRREGDPPAVWADPERARTQLGWIAQHSITQIVETAWRWHSGSAQGG